MDIFPQLEEILEKNVISKETGFTQDLKKFAIVVYEENSKYHIFVVVEGGIEKTTEFSNEEDALETALLAFHTFKTKSFTQSPEKPQGFEPHQTSFIKKKNVKEPKIERNTKNQTKTTDSSTSNDSISQWTTTLTGIVESMQESNENNSKRLERIIDRLQDSQVELQGKTREFMREISIQNADLHMRTAQMLTDINVRTLENGTAQQNRYLEHQQNVLAIENANRELEERKEREAQERREHEEKMKRIRIKSDGSRSGLFGSIGGWIDSIF